MAGLEIKTDLHSFFQEKTNKIPNCDIQTKSYIAGIFSKLNKEKEDFSKNSITIIYAQANFQYNFELFQKLGDWILFTKSLYPAFLKEASSEYYNTIAQCSYHKCYKIINKQWPLFEELADIFPDVVLYMQKELIVEKNYTYHILRL